MMRAPRSVKKPVRRWDSEPGAGDPPSPYRALFDADDAARLLVDPGDGRIVDANGAALALYGYAREELMALSWSDLAVGEQAFGMGLAPGREQVHTLAGGGLRPVKIYGGYLEGTSPRLAFVTIHDLGERRQAEEQLHLAARIFDGAAEGMVVTDPGGRILSVNNAFTRVTGYTLDEVKGKTPALLKSGRHGQDFYRDMWASLEAEGHWQGEVWNCRKSGETYAEWLSINAVRNGEGALTNYVGIFSDLSPVKESQRRIEFLATHDELTELPNRSLFNDRLRLAIARTERTGGSFAVLFVDLDNFKLINDSLGHDSGDVLLRQAARRLKDCVRAEDTVARLGGDEFVVLLEGVFRDDAVSTAQRIVEALAASYELNGQECYVSASIGITIHPDDAADAGTLMRNADTAMYRAKAMGRNGYQFFHPEMAARNACRLRMETSLRHALERQQLFLEYQPQVALGDRSPVGVEALLRWCTAGQGEAPSEFIPLVEESNLVVDIDNWVLREVCRQLKVWDSAGLRPLRASINLSARHFRVPGMVARLSGIVAEAGLPNRRLCLEINEAALMDGERTLSRLAELREAGFTVSIDDFGTGFSALACLKRLPADELKIDRSLVRNLVHKPEDCALARATVIMADSLGLNVIAEGVESVSQEEILRRAGCHGAQGHFYARPLPAIRLVPWLHRQGMVPDEL